MRNGKGDHRGKLVTVLSDKGRENFDAIFRKDKVNDEKRFSKRNTLRETVREKNGS